MKKILLLTSLFALIGSLTATAQLSYNRADTAYLNLPANGSKENASLYVTNNGSAAVDFEWRILDYALPKDWTSNGVCDWFLCQPFSDPSWHAALCSGNQTDTLYMEVGRNVGAGDGCAMAKIEFREKGQTTTEITTLIVTSFSNTSSCWPLAIEGYQVDDLLKVYPNPATETLQFEIRNEYVSEVQIRSPYGQVLEKVKMASPQMQISIANYATGLYLVEMIGKNGLLLGTTKFLKR